ncbi:MAG: hypothetical protein PHN56_01080 [Candidatus Nanoarchaeia archaeon]|nr:hypothetical protein [Candidatus Nanoarchaeia archaeon]
MDFNFPEGACVQFSFNVKSNDYLYRALKSINAEASKYYIFINEKEIFEDYYLNKGDTLIMVSKNISEYKKYFN